MADNERKKRREREKHERQMLQDKVSDKVPLFGELVRLSSSTADDSITSALGDYSEARDYINQYSVGILNTPAHQMTQRLPPSGQQQQQQQTQQQKMPPPPPHNLHQAQISRQAPYIKQADNKPPYNGRGGYPGQPVKNDVRSSSGMAPPKGPPIQTSGPHSKPHLPPPTTTIMPNGRQSYIKSNIGSCSIPNSEKSFIGPPVASTSQHNGMFSAPLPPPSKPRQNCKVEDVHQIMDFVNKTFAVPNAPLGEIGATPHTTITENYNLNEPNKHKYSFDIPKVALTPTEPFDAPVTPLAPLTSPPRQTSPFLVPMPPPSTNNLGILETPKEPVRPLDLEKNDHHPPLLEKQNSTLINDLELSDSDEDHKKDLSNSRANSSDSSQSDSSDSGSEDSSKGEPSETKTHHNNQMASQISKLQSPIMHSSNAKPVPAANVNSLANSKKKLSQTITAGGSNTISSLINNTGFGNTGTNKTPSPNDSANKWNLSTYFTKTAAQSQPIYSPTTNVPTNVTTVLPGGAHIIPEPVTPKVKNERIQPDENDDNIISNSEDEDNDKRRMNNIQAAETFRRPTVSASAMNYRKKALPRTPNSPISIKKESMEYSVAGGVNKKQSSNDFVSMTSHSIKHETHLSPESINLVPELRKKPQDFISAPQALSGLSSETNSTSETEDPITTKLIRKPGGKLQIPGVPADITPVPYKSPLLQNQQKPTLPNSITVTPIDPVPKVSSPKRQKKPRKKIKHLSQPVIESSDDEEIRQKSMKNLLITTPSVMPALSNAAAAASLQQTNVAPNSVATKKSRGRPRKTATTTAATGPPVGVPPVNTGSSGGAFIAPVNTFNSNASISKGPTLTAKKDMLPINNSQNSSAVVASAGAATSSTKKNSKKPATTSNRKKVSRQNSSPASASNSAVSCNTTPTKINTLKIPKKALQQQENHLRTESEDSSESSSTSSSNSSSSSESDDASASTSDVINEETPAPSNNITNSAFAASRRVVNLNKQGHPMAATNNSAPSHNAPIRSGIFTGISSSSSSSSEEDDDDDEDELRNLPKNNSDLVKSVSSRSRVTTSCSSATSSTSNIDEPSDADKKRKQDKKRKSDKKSALTRIFNPKDGGAKRKGGQVLVVDQSEEQQQQQQQQQQQHQHQQHQQQQQQQQQSMPKALSAHSNSLSTNNETVSGSGTTLNTVAIAPPVNSPRLTPSGQIRSPRQPILNDVSQRTPGRSSVSAERKLQSRIKTPTRTTPNRTPTPTHTPAALPPPAPVQTQSMPAPALLPPPTIVSPSLKIAAVVPSATAHANPTNSTQNVSQQSPSLICKIDISRIRVNPVWYHNQKGLTYTALALTKNPAGGSVSIPSGAGPPSNRTPQYNHHETILNADLQATRLKVPSRNLNSNFPSSNTIGGSSTGSRSSRSSTPRSTGNSTPNNTYTARSDREMSKSRESLHDLALTKPQRIEDGFPNGHSSTRSSDGNSTPKHALSTSASNTTSNSASKIMNLKHEIHLKYELEDLEYESKYNKGDLKANVAIMKHDDDIMSEKAKLLTSPTIEKEKANKSATNSSSEGKSRRKRSSSNSSNSFKDKRRKKDDYSSSKTSEFKSSEKQIPPTNHNRLHKNNDNVAQAPHKTSPNINKGYTETSDNSEKVTNEKEKSSSSSVSVSASLSRSSRDEKSSTTSPNLNTNTAKINNVLHSSDSHKMSDEHVTSASSSDENSENVSSSDKLAKTDKATKSSETHKEEGKLDSNDKDDSFKESANDGAKALEASSSLGNALTETSIQEGPSTSAAAAAAALSGGNSSSEAVCNAGTTIVKVYRSHFERDETAEMDDLNRNTKFLQEAVKKKHAADRETNPFSQIALYLEAVVYFLLSGAAMEQHKSSEDAAWTIYKDTLALIKFISSKFRAYQSSKEGQHETHNKVAILSLRCQSIISLKLYKMKRVQCRSIGNACSEYFKNAKCDPAVNGNATSGISPNSCSQGSGSNTPPGKIVSQDIFVALVQQNQYFGYLSSSIDLWDQADKLVRQGNHLDFFIELDHENGPLTLHSGMYEVFRYVQAGLKRLRDSLPSKPK